jgi:hypothetical protein
MARPGAGEIPSHQPLHHPSCSPTHTCVPPSGWSGHSGLLAGGRLARLVALVVTCAARPICPADQACCLLSISSVMFNNLWTVKAVLKRNSLRTGCLPRGGAHRVVGTGDLPNARSSSASKEPRSKSHGRSRQGCAEVITRSRVGF